MKRLSIIVPLYNSARYLPRCMNSLLHQDIPLDDYEILLINDGSPDDSGEVAESYAEKYSNIKVFSKENGGTSSARNVGIKNAAGKYLYFVDPDDYVLENSLGNLLQRMEDESLDVLRFGYIEVDEQGRPTESCKHPETPDYSAGVMDGFSFMEKRLGTACFVWTYLFRTALIQGNQLFFDELAYIDDTPWLPRVLALAERVDSVGIKRHFYTIREGSLVRIGNAEKSIAAQMWLIEELCRQSAQMANGKGERWYRKMISHSVLSLLTTVGVNAYDRKDIISSWVIEKGLVPLSLNGAAFHNRLKLRMINISPAWFCRVIHRLNS